MASKDKTRILDPQEQRTACYSLVDKHVGWRLTDKQPVLRISRFSLNLKYKILVIKEFRWKSASKTTFRNSRFYFQSLHCCTRATSEYQWAMMTFRKWGLSHCLVCSNSSASPFSSECRKYFSNDDGSATGWPSILF